MKQMASSCNLIQWHAHPAAAHLVQLVWCSRKLTALLQSVAKRMSKSCLVPWGRKQQESVGASERDKVCLCAGKRHKKGETNQNTRGVGELDWAGRLKPSSANAANKTGLRNKHNQKDTAPAWLWFQCYLTPLLATKRTPTLKDFLPVDPQCVRVCPSKSGGTVITVGYSQMPWGERCAAHCKPNRARKLWIVIVRVSKRPNASRIEIEVKN